MNTVRAPAPAHAAVIFDMDGLLLDSEPLYRSASQAAARALGHSLDDALYASLIGLPGQVVRARLQAAFGARFDPVAFACGFEQQAHELMIGQGIALKPGALTLLELLGEMRTPYAIATSTPRPRAERSLAIAGIADRAPVLVCGDEVERGKPAPDIFLRAAALLGRAPHHCVVLEDSEAGIAAAADAGMTPVMVPDLKQPGAATLARCHAVHGTLLEALPMLLDLLRAR